MEFFASDAARKRKEWDFKKWGKRVNFFLNHIEKSFNPDLIILGGGVSNKIAQFEQYININKKTIEMMWLEDLTNLEKEYEKYKKERAKRLYGKQDKSKKGKKGKKGKKA